MKINSNLITSEYNLITDGKPVKTGRKIDGKDEYVKRINFGNLPNATTKSVSTGINFADVTITKCDACPVATVNGNPTGEVNPLPFPAVAVVSNSIQYYFRLPDLIFINAGNMDRSGFTTKIDIYFTYNN